RLAGSELAVPVDGNDRWRLAHRDVLPGHAVRQLANWCWDDEPIDLAWDHGGHDELDAPFIGAFDRCGAQNPTASLGDVQFWVHAWPGFVATENLPGRIRGVPTDPRLDGVARIEIEQSSRAF